MSENYKIKIFDFVDNNIRKGVWKPGKKILSENQLAIKFDCSRLTARSVLHDLVLMGILDSVKGKGYYISSWADKLLFTSIIGDVKISNNNVVDADSANFHFEFKDKWADYFGVTQDELVTNSNIFYKSFTIDEKEVIRQKMYINKKRVKTFSHEHLSDSSIDTIRSNDLQITNHATLVAFPKDVDFKEIAKELGWNGLYPIMMDVMSDDESWLSFTIKIIRPEYFEVYSAKRIL